MLVIDRFALEPLEGPTLSEHDQTPKAWILFDGQRSDLVVEGCILEAQFAVGSQFLLLATEDCPYEEGLHIYLLSSDGELLDSVILGLPYAAGILEDLRPTSENTAEFSFFGKDRWELTVHPRAIRTLAMPFTAVHRPSALGPHWLQLRQKNAATTI